MTIIVIQLQFIVVKTQNSDTKFQEMLKAAIFSVERFRNKRVTHQEVAQEIGIAKRTFDEWMRGAYAPSAAEAVLKLICLVPEDGERARLLSIWAQSQDAVIPNRERQEILLATPHPPSGVGDGHDRE